MATWSDAIGAAAKRLSVQPSELENTLQKAEINEELWPHVSVDDFVNALKPHLGAKQPPIMKAAYHDMNAVLQGKPVGLSVASSVATVDQLIQAIDPTEPEKSEPLAELLGRPVPGQSGLTFKEIAFMVLDDKGNLDRPATRAVVELLRKGMPPEPDEILDPEKKRTYVVYRHSELPGTQNYIDPLFPEEDLKLGVSMRFKLIVHPRLQKEQHQLLLFLRRKGRISDKQVSDRPACEALVNDFATLSQEALLEKYGGRGVYEKAARLPEGAPAGLPNIVRAASGRPGIDKGVSMGRAAERSPGKASDFVRDCVTRLPVGILKDILSVGGLPLSGNRDELIDRLSSAFRTNALSFESMLTETTADLVRSLCVELDLPVGNKSDNVEALLEVSEHLEKDGAVREDDEVEA